MPCQTSKGIHNASVPWTASHHGPVRISDEITGAGNAGIRNISDVAILAEAVALLMTGQFHFNQFNLLFTQWTRARGVQG